MRQEIKEQLKGTSLARGMTDDDVEALLASSQVRLVHYKKGEIIFHEGDVPERLFLLVSGAVRILKDTYSGRQIFLGEIRKPGVMFGEVYLFIERHAYDMFTQALAATELLEISSRMLTQGAAEDEVHQPRPPVLRAGGVAAELGVALEVALNSLAEARTRQRSDIGSQARSPELLRSAVRGLVGRVRGRSASVRHSSSM